MAALVLCGAHRADYMMVSGEWRVEKVIVPGLDIEALMYRHQLAAQQLIS